MTFSCTIVVVPKRLRFLNRDFKNIYIIKRFLEVCEVLALYNVLYDWVVCDGFA